MALQKLGPYTLESVLGRGGMGTVYRAVEVGGAVVAVKALAPTLCLDEHFRQRFESEIETMLKMDHPNIVRLLGYGQDDGVMFFAMELVNGKSLFAMQKEKVLFDWRAVLRITLDVCAGLQHAHNRGIIHRDLKPGNLIREESGNVKITDFGIAKSFGGSRLTGEGSVLGTMDFMSPEQAKSGKVTVRSDLYSLGAVMFTLLARRPPLQAETLEESVRNLTTAAPPDIRTLVPSVPRPFAEVIHRLLEKDPNRRYPTALVLSKVLLDVQSALRESSEAKTETGKDNEGQRTLAADPEQTQSSVARAANPAQDTTSFEVSDELTARDKPAPAAGDATDETHVAAAAASHVAASTRATLDSQEDGKSPSPATVPTPPTDFYNPITSRERQRYLGQASEESEQRRRIWPLALALVVVLGLLCYGIYEAVFRQQSAEHLLSVIARHREQPIEVIDEIDTFLRLYPHHDQVADVGEMRSLVNAVQFRRRLNIAKGLKGLNPIEQKFIDLTDFDTLADAIELEQMIEFYEAADDLDAEGREVVAAARAYLQKFHRDVGEQTSVYRPFLENAMHLAENAEADNNPPRANAIYAAVIKFYGEKAWARDLVERARARQQ